jgi:activating signal cointegrator 1
MGVVVKGLTLTQPWATLVAIGAKRIETRSWRTDYRGPIAIHAGQGLGPVGGAMGLGAQCSVEPFWSVLRETGYHRSDMLPRGAIVAVAELVMCHHTHLLPWSKGIFEVQELQTKRTHAWSLTNQERAFGDYSPGRYAWLLADVRRLPEPIPARGALGLWNVPAEVEAALAALEVKD